MNGELLSLVVRLHAAHVAADIAARGDLLHAWFLRKSQQYNATIGQQLHDHSSAVKPFTVSLLYSDETRSGDVEAVGAAASSWFRITSLSPPVVAVLRWLAHTPPGSVMLGSYELEVAGTTLDAALHSWAACGSYAEIADAMYRPFAGPVTLDFTTPTSFANDRETILFPLPRAVFGGLIRKWNAYAPLPLAPGLADKLLDAIRVCGHEIWSERVHYAKGDPGPGARKKLHPRLGFVGRCTFTVDGRAREAVGDVARGLAAFAFFAGIGAKTGMGMGQARMTGAPPADNIADDY